LHYLHNNVLVIDQSECIEDRPVPGPFPDFPMTKREKPWERGCLINYLMFENAFLTVYNSKTISEIKKLYKRLICSFL
jgi:hypothetical protein